METERENRILLFTGDGKGKTTAALGMALRAAGHGMKSLVVQFIKSNDATGELAALKSVPEIDIVQSGVGFVPGADSPGFSKHVKNAEAGLKKVREALASNEYSLVILDEVCIAVTKQLLAEQHVLEAVNSARGDTIIVMTGRYASSGLIDVADTVTEMKCLKHGYTFGIMAQPGVEY